MKGGEAGGSGTPRSGVSSEVRRSGVSSPPGPGPGETRCHGPPGAEDERASRGQSSGGGRGPEVRGLWSEESVRQGESAAEIEKKEEESRKFYS